MKVSHRIWILVAVLVVALLAVAGKLIVGILVMD